jgi:hypothetical protein
MIAAERDVAHERTKAFHRHRHHHAPGRPIHERRREVPLLHGGYRGMIQPWHSAQHADVGHGSVRAWSDLLPILPVCTGARRGSVRVRRRARPLPGAGGPRTSSRRPVRRWRCHRYGKPASCAAEHTTRSRRKRGSDACRCKTGSTLRQLGPDLVPCPRTDRQGDQHAPSASRGAKIASTARYLFHFLRGCCARVVDGGT